MACLDTFVECEVCRALNEIDGLNRRAKEMLRAAERWPDLNGSSTAKNSGQNTPFAKPWRHWMDYSSM